MTAFALMPLALGLSGGGNGLISSSLAITVVVPVGYSLLRSGRRRKGKSIGGMN